MNILHVIPSLARESGGPAQALAAYAACYPPDWKVTVATTNDGDEASRVQIASSQNVRVCFFQHAGSHSFKFSPGLLRFVWTNAHQFDAIHTHAAFSISADLAALIAVIRGHKLVYRPLGTLSPWSLGYGLGFFKKLYLNLLLKPALKRAYAIHCTSELEANDIISLIPESKTRIVPIPIPLPEAGPALKKATPEEIRFGFLSRIDPKKNLEALMQAFSEATFKMQATLTVAGSGSPEYHQEIRAKAASLTLENRKIVFTGFLSGEAKKQFFLDIDFLVLPSFHENFGIVVAEALAFGVPVIISDGVTLDVPPSFSGAVIRIQTDVESITAGLEKAAMFSPGDWNRASETAFSLANTQFSNAAVGAKLIALYQ
jgi:glycosyltransferase involved in cell wall biosynthesis